MTHERRLKIARQIVNEAISAHLADAKTHQLTDMAPEDRNAIVGMVEQIANGAQRVEFAFLQDPQDIWPRSTDPDNIWARSN